MIITTINNNKLFIQFDRVVKSGLLHIYDDHDFKKDIEITDSEFEVINLPGAVEKIHIEIDIESENRIIKTINLNK